MITFSTTTSTFNLCKQFWRHKSLTDALVVIEDRQKKSTAWNLAWRVHPAHNIYGQTTITEAAELEAGGPFPGTSHATRGSTQSPLGKASLVWGVPTRKLLALEGRGSAGGDSARCSGLVSSYACAAMQTVPRMRGRQQSRTHQMQRQPSVRHVHRIIMGCRRISSVPYVPTASFGAEQLCSHTRFASVASDVYCCSALPVCARAVFVAALGQSQYGKAAPPIPARATRQWQVRASPHANSTLLPWSGRFQRCARGRISH